ncbi:MAG: MBL fold metallo-hydrolase, partial [Caldilineae bacterium]
LEKAAGLQGTAEAGARQMFRSVRRFKELPDYLQVWPAHGAGSACGKGLGAIPSTTVGYEKLFNPMLQIEDEDAFVQALLEGQPESPKYFAVMKRVNKEGPAVLNGLPHAPLLPTNRLQEVLDAGATVVDTRPPGQFAEGHVPGTINIPLESLASWAGWLVSYEKPYYLIVDQGQCESALQDLVYIGLDNVAGMFETEAIHVLEEAGVVLQTYDVATPEELAEDIRNRRVLLVDVRNESEWQEGHIPGARHVMLGYLADRAAELINGQPIVVQCRTGNRSALGASVLQALGARKVINMVGGIQRWEQAQLEIER